MTSNGGPEGNRFVEILLDRLEELLDPSGRALIYVFQLVKDRQPLIIERLAEVAGRRSVELTPSQENDIPFETYRNAYDQLFPEGAAAIECWGSDLIRRHGSGLGLCHYVVDVGPQSDAPTDCVVRGNFAEKFGAAFLVPSEDLEELALGRVFENFVPSPSGGEQPP